MKARVLTGVICGVLALYASAEVGVRAAGLTDFPLYRLDAAARYEPAPSQAGAFLDVRSKGRNDWRFNDLSMGTAQPFQLGGTLIVGDSVVMGGVVFKWAQTLDAQVTGDAGAPVWTASAGGWQFLNELGYLRGHPQALTARRIVFVVNSGDFGPAADWDDQLTHPTHKPLLAIPYLIAKAAGVSPAVKVDPAPTPASVRAWRADLHQFLTVYRGRVDFILYPKRIEEREGGADFDVLRSALADEHRAGVRMIDIAADPRWTIRDYRDAIHPSVAGTGLLATIIASDLASRS